MVQDYNAQNKLLMNEWSFIGLHIPLQTPTVIGLTTIALFFSKFRILISFNNYIYLFNTILC